MSVTIDVLKPQLERLRLKGLLTTLPTRLEQGREQGMSHLELLNLLFQDEIERREATCLKKRFQTAQFESHNQTFETLVTKHYPIQLKQRLQELKSLHFLSEIKNVILMGPTGTGKSHIAHAIGHQACRMKHSVLFCRANQLFQKLKSARADGTYQQALKKHTQVELLILDDFGLLSLNEMQAEDFYELVAMRAHKKPILITSNRTVDAWIKLFPDPVMANAVLDRLANVAYQIVIEGDSYRKNQRVDLKITIENES